MGEDVNKGPYWNGHYLVELRTYYNTSMKCCFSQDNWRGVLLSCTVVVSTVAFSFDLVSFQHAKETVLYAGLLGVCLCVALTGVRVGQGFRFYLPLWLWLGWALLSGIFTARYIPYLLIECLRFGTLLLFASVCLDLTKNEIWRQRIGQTLMISGGLVAGLGLLQYIDLLPGLFPDIKGYTQAIYSVFGNQAFFGGYLAVIIPLSLFELTKTKHFRFAEIALAGLLLAGLVLSASRSAWLAAAVGTVLVWPWRQLPIRRTLWTAAGIGGVVAGTVLLGWPQVEGRIRDLFTSSDVGGSARLWYWDGTLRMVKAAPVAGKGLGHYPYWSPHYLGLALWAPGGERHSASEIHTVHAHNEPLEFGAETGGIGLVFGVWMLLRLARRQGPEWGGLAALLVFCLFNAGLHSLPHALAGLLLAGMLQERGNKEKTGEFGRGGKARWAFVLAAAIFGVTHAGLVLIPGYLLRSAEKAHVAGDNALPLYERAVRFPYTPPETWEVYGLALLEAGQTREALDALHKAQSGLDTGRLHLLLGMAHLEVGDFEKAKEALTACVLRWPFHKDAWRTLDLLTPEDEREALRNTARRWGITFDAGDAATSAASTAP